jgi:hypothetical protein
MIEGNSILTVLAQIGGPGIVGGMLCKWLEESTPTDVYDMAIKYKDKNVWEILPPEWKEKLNNFQGKVDVLSRLDIDWAIQELYKGNRADLASLVINTPEVATFVEKVISDLQQGVKGFDRKP